MCRSSTVLHPSYSRMHRNRPSTRVRFTCDQSLQRSFLLSTHIHNGQQRQFLVLALGTDKQRGAWGYIKGHMENALHSYSLYDTIEVPRDQISNRRILLSAHIHGEKQWDFIALAFDMRS